MNFPEELVEKAKFEISIYKRVSQSTGTELIAEVERLRSELAASQAREEVLRDALTKERHIHLDGWIEWNGGECPVPPETMVCFVLRDGYEGQREHVASALRWSHDGTGSDIIAYKVVTSAETSDGWIKWRGGECPVQPDTVVRYRLRNTEASTDKAGKLVWDHDGGMFDIIAYEVVALAPLKPEGA